ncbi:GTPase domain-containing protein [Actinomyces bowdenii]|uniref:ABC transporter n=1 Tax=Actinomyces bowdenii TaxID=131109 RepID=A0A3P1V7V6_9ACTO|nr:GTPase domain-containing protein [Actinomyces bowdenii]RRD29747.1 ABC transporter [Actinomyces bowdenii]
MPVPASPRRRAEEDVPVSALSRAQLLDVLTDLLHDLDQLDLTLRAEGVEEDRALHATLIGQVRDQVIPRLQDADIPSIVVVGGSTGAGKSTLVNSILDQEVTEAGVLRPTTRTPVLVVNPEDEESLADHPLKEACVQVSSPAIPAGLALIDASDLDSVHEANRALAGRLLDAADLWLFVTTAARYGDQTPWATLEEAAGRETPIAVVLNRVPATILSEVRRDLAARLQSLGLSEAPFFVVPDAGPHEGMLPRESVAEVRDWLQLLAGRHRAAGLVRRAGKGVWTALRADLSRLSEAADAQRAAAQQLEDLDVSLRQAAVDRLRMDLERGSAGEGATATRWLTLASAGGPLAALAQGGRLRRGFLGRAEKARAQALEVLSQDAREALAAHLQAAVVGLLRRAERTWQEAGAGQRAERLLGQGDPAATTIEAWSGYLAANVKAAPKGLSPRSAVDLLVACACGVEGAVSAARRLGLEAQVEEARSLLMEAVEEALTATVPPGAAASLAPASGFAAALRLRAGELKPFTRPGASA